MQMIQVKILEIFAWLPGGKTTGPGDIYFFYFSLFLFIYFYLFAYLFLFIFLLFLFFPLNLALISGAKSNGHRDTWTGVLFGVISVSGFFVRLLLEKMDKDYFLILRF